MTGRQHPAPVAVDDEALTQPPYEPVTRSPDRGIYRLADLALCVGIILVLVGCALWIPKSWVDTFARLFWAALTVSA